MRKTRNLYIFLLFLLLPGMPALSQRKILAGVVKDAHSDEPVPFASLQFINSTVGKLSDSSGAFIFNLSQWPSDTLEITCVGYQPYKLFILSSLDSMTVDIV
ncbi:MAG TPA: carboxypeptidase-like regulatory domain-containing protein, partial [Chitinophagaceae bacterium]|nr:carboxypeptidase-like regulatory domain-containing protein [Chitinophagaceae bacterium]